VLIFYEEVAQNPAATTQTSSQKIERGTAVKDPFEKRAEKMYF
jgi:hypothetical protein